MFGDIVNVNASFNGYAKGYGEKLYNWYEYVAQNYPEGTIAGKTDDDFFGCSNLYDVGKGIFLFQRKVNFEYTVETETIKFYHIFRVIVFFLNF